MSEFRSEIGPFKSKHFAYRMGKTVLSKVAWRSKLESRTAHCIVLTGTAAVLFSFFFFDGGGSMSNRAKFLVVRSALLPENQKLESGQRPLSQISKVQQSLRFIRRRIAFKLGLASRGGSAAFRNRRNGQISYLTKHFFDQQLVRITLCLIMIAPIAAVFCISQPPQSAQSATIEQSQALPNWLNFRISQSKGSDYWADWQASPYGKASAAAQAAHVNWTRVFFHVMAVLWLIVSDWRLMLPLVLMLLFFRSARQAKVSGKRFNLKQSMRQPIQYFAPFIQVFLPATQKVGNERRVAVAPVLQIAGKQQRFAQWKIKLKQRALD